MPTPNRPESPTENPFLKRSANTETETHQEHVVIPIPPKKENKQLPITATDIDTTISGLNTVKARLKILSITKINPFFKEESGSTTAQAILLILAVGGIASICFTLINDDLPRYLVLGITVLLGIMLSRLLWANHANYHQLTTTQNSIALTEIKTAIANLELAKKLHELTVGIKLQIDRQTLENDRQQTINNSLETINGSLEKQVAEMKRGLTQFGNEGTKYIKKAEQHITHINGAAGRLEDVADQLETAGEAVTKVTETSQALADVRDDMVIALNRLLKENEVQELLDDVKEITGLIANNQEKFPAMLTALEGKRDQHLEAAYQFIKCMQDIGIDSANPVLNRKRASTRYDLFRNLSNQATIRKEKVKSPQFISKS